MSWEKEYQSKLMKADQALDYVKSGERVVIGHACAEPSHLVETMVSKAEQYENVEIVHMVAMGKAGYAQPDMEKHFRHNALFVGGSTRKAVAEGRGDFTPCFFYRVPSLFTNGSLPVDVALIQATPPDENGNMSLGISVDYTLPAARAAKKVIVQVNKELPRTYGDSCINVSDTNIVAIVEHDAPIIELAPPKIGEVERAIGANCANLIHDGDTLQLGIGAIPDAVLLFLKEKKDLGIHSEMFSDGVVELVEQGVITNAKKTTHPGKFVANFLMGTKRLYNFVNNNPDVELYPVDYVNHPMVVMKEDNIVSINSCVQLDLMGQAASETIGYTQISGVGGQVDFIRGATMAKNGRSILAFPSTAAKGTVSKIVPLLDEGAAVTTSRNDVDYAVTEYGIAKLAGKSLKDRARALIEIAHPDFRDALKNVYEERFHCNY
ncbi:MAG: acetyl-CoA hydrolase/transferase family protein [Lachnospiraceae bacterium]|nr:acetyl-CoA hydrolase/transferase family protein [Lachnospiraceae bacterium]